MSEIVRPFYIMAKPVCGVCNLDCRYCYYTMKPAELYPGVTKFMMTDEVLEKYVREYCQVMPVQANFGWQGGEPLLAGKDFFRKAVDWQKEYGVEGGLIANALQTNGTLLDDEWCEFLAEYNFLVGLSLDGPPEWHDRFRLDPNGEGTFHRAWAGLELLRKHGVEFNILVTLNAKNAPHIGDIYRYFVNRGIHWLQFIPILELDEAGQPEPYSCSSEQFGRFMLDVFELWRGRYVGAVSERLIDSVLHTIVHGEAALCCNAVSCANAHVLEFNGDLYACDHFVFAEWLIGNIMETPLAELVTSPKLAEFARLKTELPDACRDCEYLPYCNSGCPKHHLPPATTGDAKRVNHFCEGYKMFFREALPELQRIAEYIKRGQTPPAPGAPEAPGAPGGPVGAASAPAADPAPSRNSPCPCGSGRKYKHCCGKQ